MFKTNETIDFSSLQSPSSQKMYSFFYRAGVMNNFDQTFFLYSVFFAIIVTGSYMLNEFSALTTIFSLLLAFIPTFFILLILNNRWKKRFQETFPDGLDIIVQSLRAAQPLSSSLLIARDLVNSPLKEEMTLITNEMDLGTPISLIMRRASQKIGMEEFTFFTSALVIQEQTGSSLSDTLSRLSEIIRSRLLMRLKIQALSAEARVSAYIMIFLILAMFTFLSFTLRKNIYFLFFDPTGQIMGIIAIFMLIIGFSIVLKLSRIKV